MGGHPIHWKAISVLAACGLTMGMDCGHAQTPPRSTKPVSATVSLKSPIEPFRQLLAASPAEREKLLATNRPELRKVLQNNLRSYDQLKPEEREFRLRTMELRFYLTELMRLPSSNRTERLKLVPPSERALVEERLRMWDQFPPADQKVLLENGRIVRVSAVLIPGGGRRDQPLNSAASNQFFRMQRDLDLWQKMPEAQRLRVQKNFEKLFELPSPEKARQLEPLSAAEREQMEKTIDQFKKLSKPQRDLCIQNFNKFAELTVEERRQFLRNAEEWQKMSSEDRRVWRTLVTRVPPLPPTPPGMGEPPVPPVPRSTLKTAVSLTNR